MEALYMGIPVIGSRAGGIPEILRDEDALFSTDWMSLAEKIETCRENPLFLSHLRDAQRARKEELTFDWAEKILELISGDAEQE
jgi:glycosyltransferase involved in cell wall biosynthesis